MRFSLPISAAFVAAVLVWSGTSRGQLYPANANPKIQIHPTAEIHPSAIIEGTVKIGAFTHVGANTVITGNVTIGHHVNIQCNTTIRGRNTIGNYAHIYDNVNIEGGRPAKVGTSTAEVSEQGIIGDYAWVNHGAVMHGTHIGEQGAVGINTACDYGTVIGAGAILTNGSATRVGQVIPDNSLAEGVPAAVKRRNITDQDRIEYFGLLPKGWALYAGQQTEARIRKRLGL